VVEIAVVGNATQDRNRAGLRTERRPGGTLLYASLALTALGHDVVPVGYAPLRAYNWMWRSGLDLTHVRVGIPGILFMNKYPEDDSREQWARGGPRGPLTIDDDVLDRVDGVLLGPVLGEVSPETEIPETIPGLVDLQGNVRSLGSPNPILGWRPVEVDPDDADLPSTTHVRGSLQEAAALTDEEDPQPAARTLAERTGAAAVVTAAGDGAVGWDGRLHQAVPPHLEVEDPTGAGDVFDAGLLHGLVAGDDLGEAMRWGCGAAGAFLDREWQSTPLKRFPGREAARRQAKKVTLERAEAPGDPP
jgi:sugar/nucleoside kinase (ribokinase family)